MHTALDCMPCFMKMALRDARLACPEDESMHHEIVTSWARMLGGLDLHVPPPAIARHLLALIEEKTGCGDLYAKDKREANDRVLKLLPELRGMVQDRRERGGNISLALALELAIIGNYIDRGVDLQVDWEEELANVSSTLPDDVFREFSAAIAPGAEVLILGDNTGEIVLDMLLVEELQQRGCAVTYVVRSRPIINDATMEDAEYVGITKLCHVMESGVDTPGTVLERCSPGFLERLEKADVVISKGQGNFESLYGVYPGVYCAFKVKCKRVASETGLPLGRTAFVKTPKVNERHPVIRALGTAND